MKVCLLSHLWTRAFDRAMSHRLLQPCKSAFASDTWIAEERTAQLITCGSCCFWSMKNSILRLCSEPFWPAALQSEFLCWSQYNPTSVPKARLGADRWIARFYRDIHEHGLQRHADVSTPQTVYDKTANSREINIDNINIINKQEQAPVAASKEFRF